MKFFTLFSDFMRSVINCSIIFLFFCVDWRSGKYLKVIIWGQGFDSSDENTLFFNSFFFKFYICVCQVLQIYISCRLKFYFESYNYISHIRDGTDSKGSLFMRVTLSGSDPKNWVIIFCKFSAGAIILQKNS